MLRNHLVVQANTDAVPAEFVEATTKQTWSLEWKDKTRQSISDSNGVVGIITQNTPLSSGQVFEIECAYAAARPTYLVYGTSDRPMYLPSILQGREISQWEWSGIAAFMNRA
jgi:hypothetical protein